MSTDKSPFTHFHSQVKYKKLEKIGEPMSWFASYNNRVLGRYCKGIQTAKNNGSPPDTLRGLNYCKGGRE